MEHEVTHLDRFTVIALKGEVDMRHSPQARKIILAHLEKMEPLIVELSGVRYIDSSGIASLVEGLQCAKTQQLDFCLAGISPQVMNVLKLARLDRVFIIHARPEEALV